jgi:hypothetical protein
MDETVALPGSARAFSMTVPPRGGACWQQGWAANRVVHTPGGSVQARARHPAQGGGAGVDEGDSSPKEGRTAGQGQSCQGDAGYREGSPRAVSCSSQNVSASSAYAFVQAWITHTCAHTILAGALAHRLFSSLPPARANTRKLTHARTRARTHTYTHRHPSHTARFKSDVEAGTAKYNGPAASGPLAGRNFEKKLVPKPHWYRIRIGH